MVLLLEVIVFFYLLVVFVGMLLKKTPLLLLLPFAPFLTGAEIMKTRPFWGWTLIVLTSILYLLLAFIIIIGSVFFGQQ